jgi:hypothetical protein
LENGAPRKLQILHFVSPLPHHFRNGSLWAMFL